MIKNDYEARLDDVYYNLIKILDTEYKVCIEEVFIAYGQDKSFYSLYFINENKAVEVQLFHDELKNHQHNIYRYILDKWATQVADEKWFEYNKYASNFKTSPEDFKSFIDLFPVALMVNHKDCKYKLKAGDKVLYKGYIATLQHQDEDGDFEVAYGSTSNTFPLEVFYGCDIIHISKKKRKESAFDVEYAKVKNVLEELEKKESVRLMELGRRAGKSLTFIEEMERVLAMKEFKTKNSGIFK